MGARELLSGLFLLLVLVDWQARLLRDGRLVVVVDADVLMVVELYSS